MSAELIDGKAVAASVRAEIADEVAALIASGQPQPGLATVLVGDDAASDVYVSNKQRACAEVGIKGFDHRLPADSDQATVAALLDELAADPAVSGILLQLPVPGHLNSDALVERIPAAKDVDGLTPVSAGRLALGYPGLRPCTPSGVIVLLERYGVELSGAQVAVIGRSNLVGKPLVPLLLEQNATVAICHSRTKDLEAVTRAADVVIAAVGVPRLIGATHISPGAVVIDVGINREADGLVGDVDFAAVAPIARAITPVPGGVGPMTIAMLLRNTLTAARATQ